MVAAALLGIGLLGLAGMQGISLGRNVDSNDLGRVTTLAADMMDRIKYNRQRALAYNGINTLVPGTQPPATEPMARGDYAQWQTMLNNSGLRNAQGTITVVRLDADPTLNPVTLNQFSIAIRINWTGGTGEDSTRLAKSVVFSNVLAPE
jgi:type IV pilus assembly protein PilV